ncbi:MAG TPA: alpha/beta hydrolase [Mycobacteriales bacterium]|jgi:pimeloyl-ACP methyl ester carboxylesterase|nr:alpha/beta hydrolase [Mycobacteriales bacterium]
MPSYTSDGLTLHYETAGSGPALLCIHSATSTGSYEWDHLTRNLSDSFRVVKPDLRGHGESDHRSGQLALELIEEDLRELIAHESLGRPHLLGFSFGSEVALRLALDHPGIAQSLILLSPGLGTAKKGAAARAEVPSRETLESRWPKGLRRLHAERHGPDHWIDIMQDLWVRHAERTLISLEDLQTLTIPMLLICGSDDDPRRLEQSRLFAATNPLARHIEIEGGGHAVHKDRVEQVEPIIAEFLRDL